MPGKRGFFCRCIRLSLMYVVWFRAETWSGSGVFAGLFRFCLLTAEWLPSLTERTVPQS